MNNWKIWKTIRIPGQSEHEKPKRQFTNYALTPNSNAHIKSDFLLSFNDHACEGQALKFWYEELLPRLDAPQVHKSNYLTEPAFLLTNVVLLNELSDAKSPEIVEKESNVAGDVS